MSKNTQDYCDLKIEKIEDLKNLFYFSAAFLFFA